MDLAALGIKLATDKLRQGLRELEAAQKKIDGLADSADDVGKKSESGFARLSRAAKGAAGGLSAVESAILSLGAAFSVGAIIDAADSFTKLTAQLKLSTNSTEQFATAFENVRNIARSAQGDINAIATLYARINSATQQLGISQTQVSQITESVALALKANGASAAEASSAMLQLSQAFGSGVLRGEEFNSINEAAPALIRAVADQLGVTQGEMRKLAEEGKLTSAVLAEALPAALNKFRVEAAQMQTIGGSVQQLKNSFTLMIGEIDKGTGSSSALSRAISELATDIEAIGPAVARVINEFGPLLAGGAIAVGIAGIAQLFATLLTRINPIIAGLTLAGSAISYIISLLNKDANELKTLTGANAQIERLSKEADTAKKKLDALREANAQPFMIAAEEKRLAFIQKGLDKATESRNKHIESIKQEGSYQDLLNESWNRGSNAVNLLGKGTEKKAKAQKDSYNMADKLRQAQEQYNKELEQTVNAEMRQTDSIRDQVTKLREQAATIGMSGAMLLEYSQAQIDADIATAEFNLRLAESGNAARETIEPLRARIQALKELKAAQVESFDVRTDDNFKRQLEQQAKARKDAEERANKQIADDMSRALFDAIVRGSSPAKALKDVIEAQTYRIVLQPVMDAFTQQVAAQLRSIVNQATAAIDGALGKGATAGLLINQSTILGGFKQGVFQGVQSAGGALIGNLVGGPIGSIIGAKIGESVGKFTDKALGIRAGETRQGQSYRLENGAINIAAGPSGGAIADDAARQATQATIEGINEALRGLGSQAIVDSFLSGLESSSKGRGGVFVGGTLSSGTAFGETRNIGGVGGFEGTSATSLDSEQAFKNYITDLNQAFLQALQAESGNFESNIRDFLTGLGDVELLSDQALLDAQNIVAQLDFVNDNFRNLTGNLSELSGASVETIRSFFELVGGIEGLDGALSNFIGKFYSQAEQLELNTRNVESAFAQLNLATPKTRAEFRALVESQDLTTEAGRKTYAALLGMSDALDAILPPFEALKEVIQETGRTAAELAQERLTLENRLLQLQGDTAELRRRELEALDPSNRALLEQIFAIEDSRAALEAAREAQDRYNNALSNAQNAFQTATQAVQSAQAAVDSAEAQIASIRDRATQNYINAQQRVIDLQREATRAMSDQGRAIKRYLADLNTSAASGRADNRAGLRLRFDMARQQALTGDASAAAEAMRLGQEFISASQDYTGSFTDYLRDVASVRKGLTEVANVAGEQVDPLVESNEQLAQAQNELARALNEANAIGAPLFASQESLIAEFAAANHQFQAAVFELGQAQNTKTIADLQLAELRSLSGKIQFLSNSIIDAYNRIDASFIRFDLNLDELLTFDELRQGLKGLATNDEVKFIITALDQNLSGGLDQVEVALGKFLGDSGALKTAISNGFTGLNKIADQGLTLEELQVGLAGLATESGLRSIFAELDTNGDGTISQLEALNGKTQALSGAIRANLAPLFDQLTSVSGEGLTRDEFANAFASFGLGSKLDAVFNEIDVNGSGTISKLEAVNAAAQFGNLTSEQILNRLNQDSILSYSKQDVAAAYAHGGKTIAHWLSDIAQYTFRSAGFLEQIKNTGIGTSVGGTESSTTSPTTAPSPAPAPAPTTTTTTSPTQSISQSALDDAIRYYLQFEPQQNQYALFVRAQQRGVSQGDFLSAVQRISGDSGFDGADLAFLQSIYSGAGYNGPAFMRGGMHSGGMRLVGERGPELEVTGPSRIFSFEQTRRMLGGGSELVEELRELRAELAQQKQIIDSGLYAVAKNTMGIDRRLERFDDGDRLRISIDQEPGETVNVTVTP